VREFCQVAAYLSYRTLSRFYYVIIHGMYVHLFTYKAQGKDKEGKEALTRVVIKGP
jgi:hypothetical protein